MTELKEDLYIPQRVVAIVAHADDIEFGMSGTIAKWTANGAAVTYVIVTDSSSGSNEPGADLDALVETRKQEQLRSAQAAGVADVRFLDYKDGVLQPTLELRKELTRIIRERRPQVVMMLDPTTIITHDGGYINHPDHRAAGEAALYATFPSAETRPIFMDLLEEGLEPHKVNKVYMTLTENPTVVVNITETFEQKMEALRCHASQIGDEAFEMIRKWNQQAGEPFGLMYAETFRVLNLHDDDTA